MVLNFFCWVYFDDIYIVIKFNHIIVNIIITANFLEAGQLSFIQQPGCFFLLNLYYTCEQFTSVEQPGFIDH
jgi:hypothetical protein